MKKLFILLLFPFACTQAQNLTLVKAAQQHPRILFLKNEEKGIKETIKKDLPEGFQTAEFVLEHGFLDFIVNRNELKKKISTLLQMIWSQKQN